MSHNQATSDKFLPVAEPDLGPLEVAYVGDAVASTWVSSLGPYVDRFESQFAAFCGSRYAIAVSNGTAAIHLALVASGVGPGHEVIVPALTFVATAAAVRHTGAKPVFVDSEPDIGTMDPVAVRRAITPATKAIIPVHLYGHPVDMDPILDVARERGIAVIEDAAEAHGASYKGRTVGSMGVMGTFSFYGNKIITTGEGGAVVTDDVSIVEHVRLLKDHAMDPHRRYWHPELGFNYRITNIQAALGCAQLERFAELTAKRQCVLDRYREAFAGTGIAINPSRPWGTPVPWLVCGLLPEGTPREARDRLLHDMKSRGIDTRPYFHPLCDMPPYRDCRRVGRQCDDIPVAESLSARGMNLPSVTWLTTEPAMRVLPALLASAT